MEWVVEALQRFIREIWPELKSLLRVIIAVKIIYKAADFPSKAEKLLDDCEDFEELFYDERNLMRAVNVFSGLVILFAFLFLLL